MAFTLLFGPPAASRGVPQGATPFTYVRFTLEAGRGGTGGSLATFKVGGQATFGVRSRGARSREDRPWRSAPSMGNPTIRCQLKDGAPLQRSPVSLRRSPHLLRAA